MDIHGLWLEPPGSPHSGAMVLGGHQGVKKGRWPGTKKTKFPNMSAARIMDSADELNLPGPESERRPI